MPNRTDEHQLNEQETRIRDEIESRFDSMLGDLERWVSIPTGWNHVAGLDELRGTLTQRLEALGASVEVIPGSPKPDWLLGAADGRIPPTAVCRRPTENGPRILIACHMDTVFDPGGAFQRLNVTPDRLRAVGPGCIDMKGGILIALTALEALEQVGVRPSFTFMLTGDEETGSYCSDKALVDEAEKHDVGLVTEPALPGGELAIKRMGSGQFQIEARGRAAHVGRAFTEGVSAVEALAEAIISACRIADPKKGRIVNIGPLAGGDATNVVPDRARAWGNVRFPTHEIAEELAAMLDDLQKNLRPGPAQAAHLGEDPDAEDHPLPSVVVRRSFNRPAKPLTPQVEQLGMMARGAAESLGQSLPFASTGGVCDGNVLQSAGLPTIDTLGVRGGGMHTVKEWIELSSLTERAQLFALLVSRITHRGFPPV